MTPAAAHAALSFGVPDATDWLATQAEAADPESADSVSVRRTALADLLREDDPDWSAVCAVGRAVARALLAADGLAHCARCLGGGCWACGESGTTRIDPLTARLGVLVGRAQECAR